MRRILALLATVCAASPAFALSVPPHDHVIVVVMENKNFYVASAQPYTMSLMTLGATFTHSYGVTHPSQPNYIALWAGSTLGVSNDNCPAPGGPFIVSNLGQACQAAGKTWRAYSENLAFAGSTACSYNGSASTGLYTRKHDPWTQFTNVNHANERPYTDLATDIAANQLPNLAFVIPNNCHNSHNSTTPGCGVADADVWLSQTLPGLITAAGPQGLVILTWDEDDFGAGNQILTVFVGGYVIPGAVSARAVTHYTIVRTICDALGLPPMGDAVYETPITDVWQTPVPTRGVRWGELKIRYR